MVQMGDGECVYRPLASSRMKIGYDRAKNDRNIRERGFGFDFAALIFRGETIERQDDRQDYGEVRVVALGEVNGLVLSSSTRIGAIIGR